MYFTKMIDELVVYAVAVFSHVNSYEWHYSREFFKKRSCPWYGVPLFSRLALTTK